MNRQPLRVRERLERYCQRHPIDAEHGPLDWLLIGACIVGAMLALAWCAR